MPTTVMPSDSYMRTASARFATDWRNTDMVFAIAIIGLALLIGGAYDDWPLSHLFLQCLAVAYLAFAFVRGGAIIPVAWPARLIVLAILAMPALQIIPLPPSIVDSLPGREMPASMAALAGLGQTWRTMSVEPLSTLSSFVALWPAIAVFIAVHHVNAAERLRLFVGVSIFIALGMALAAAQFLFKSSMLELQDIEYQGIGMGFFRNRNHMAVMVVAWMPIVILLVSRLQIPMRLKITLGTTALVIMFAVVLVTISRAGLILAAMMITAIATYLVAQKSKPLALVLPVLAMLGAGLILWLGSSGQLAIVLGRFEGNTVSADLRWPIIQQSMQVSEKFWPVGSGGGSFESVFVAFEPLSLLTDRQINAAHNDYVQVIFEYGLAGLLAIIAALVWFAVCFRRALHNDADTRNLRFACFAAIAAFVLHSVVDYPLRAPACMALFAMFAAVVSSFGTSAKTEKSV